jgi:hypothetical protein
MKKIISLVVVGVLLLGVLSASATIGKRNKTLLNAGENEISSVSAYQDELDQFQLDQTEGYAIPVGALYIPDPPTNLNVQVAQSFIPTKEILTRAELLVGKNYTASHPYVLAIREELTEENIVEINVNPDQFVTDNFSWVEFDFEDIFVTVGQTYYIVCYTENITDNWYAWAANNDSESYQHGCAWVSIDDGDTWSNDSYSAENNVLKRQNGAAPLGRDDSTSDMCFKTYGIEATELEIELTKTGFRVGATITNIGDVTAWEVEWTITVQGGIFGLINMTIPDIVPELNVGESLHIPIGPMFGLGPVTITAKAWALNAPEVTDSLDGFVIIIFFI